MASILDVFTNGMTEAVESVTLESEYTPTIVINRPLATDPNAKPTPDFISKLKPRVSLKLIGNVSPFVYTPGEVPVPESKWPIVKGSLIAAGIVFGVFFFRGLTCRCKR